MAPSSSGLGQRIFVPFTGVRIPVGSMRNSVAQLAEAVDLGSTCCGFDSHPGYSLGSVCTALRNARGSYEP
jgi:hypothetical protein